MDPPRRKRSLNIRDTRIAGLYDLEHTIGQGHFAVVKLAKHVFTGERVAVKIIDKSNLDPVSTVHIMQEVRCMKLVQHANIVRLYEVIDTQTKLFLILELGDYDMYDFLTRHEKGVVEPLAQQYFSQIIAAIDYCHRLHVVHRDLKPENVVFFEKLGMVKLTDFGFSNLYEPGTQLLTACGSLAYSAPEILLGDAYDAPPVDVWSLGVILYMLVCGRLPFQETNDSETLTKILDCKYSLPDDLSTSCKNLIQRMLVRDPKKRATLVEIVSNPWVMAGDRGHAQALPLIERHHLSHSAHTTIIEQMVAGDIGTEERILSALENDEYNSMTATYYLLAERILATCREQQAQELMAQEAQSVPEEEPIDGESSRVGGTTGSNSRCRSRSNSWRARPCTILKEESEEELSSYLRSASRQSSRLYDTNSRGGRGSRQSSIEDEEHRPAPHTLTFRPPSSLFDELSPIQENSIVSERHLERHLEGVRPIFARTSSAPEQEFRTGLVRRNSSPSISMFGGSVRDRVSPQAVQDMLELSRISSRGRAASPESIRSSRSPSPPASSSGRASPSLSSLSSLSRLKVTSVGLSGGIRKLSSSPHLLGICEEGEDERDSSERQNSSLLNPPKSPESQGRTSRSASTGLVHVPRHGAGQPTKTTASLQQTYSAVRMIRPRHAVVSPDVCRRYDQHQRFIARSRRSTSCSSSEASDDEEGKRLSMLTSSNYCARRKDHNDKDDDSTGGPNNGGVGSTSRGGEANVSSHMSSCTNAAGNGTSAAAQGDKKSNSSSAQERRVCPNEMTSSVNQLHPIPEMAALDSDKDQRLRARLLHRSHTAERILRDWSGVCGSCREDYWFGTPPREMDPEMAEKWIRTLNLTKSCEDLSTCVDVVGENSEDCSLELLDSSATSSEEHGENASDSGCSSSLQRPLINEISKLKQCSSLERLLYNQPRKEKVNDWLRCTLFAT